MALQLLLRMSPLLVLVGRRLPSPSLLRSLSELRLLLPLVLVALR